MERKDYLVEGHQIIRPYNVVPPVKLKLSEIEVNSYKKQGFKVTLIEDDAQIVRKNNTKNEEEKSTEVSVPEVKNEIETKQDESTISEVKNEIETKQDESIITEEISNEKIEEKAVIPESGNGKKNKK